MRIKLLPRIALLSLLLLFPLDIGAACFTVEATAGRVVDGDTFLTEVEIWPGLKADERIRVLGVDTPEMKGTTKPAAVEAQKFTQAWLAKGPFTIKTCGRDSFGRLLGTVIRGDENLASALIGAGMGVKR